jgi:hypothetical protein
MKAHPPPLPLTDNWVPAPQFVDDRGFGFNPRAVGCLRPDGTWVTDDPPPPPPPEPVGPPDVLADLATELAALEDLAYEARWVRRPVWVASRTVARLAEIVALLGPLLAADPPPQKRAIDLLPVPVGMVAFLGDLYPPAREARRAVRYLLDRRDSLARRRRSRAEGI